MAFCPVLCYLKIRTMCMLQILSNLLESLMRWFQFEAKMNDHQKSGRDVEAEVEAVIWISRFRISSQSVNRYWMILKKVSLGIFRIILVSEEGKNFAMESEDRELSLSKF